LELGGQIRAKYYGEKKARPGHLLRFEVETYMRQELVSLEIEFMNFRSIPKLVVIVKLEHQACLSYWQGAPALFRIWNPASASRRTSDETRSYFLSTLSEHDGSNLEISTTGSFEFL
jgi:hypothetical protein